MLDYSVTHVSCNVGSAVIDMNANIETRTLRRLDEILNRCQNRTSRDVFETSQCRMTCHGSAVS